MKFKRKGFTLIELIVVMAIIAILVLIAAPKFMGYTQKAKLTQVINDIKVSEKAAEQYYLQNDLWPRDQTATPYTLTQLNTWVDDFRNLSGETVTLEPGDYYDVDWELMKPFMAKPENDFKYIIQNPVGDIYYVNDLTPAGEQTKFAGENQITTEPIIEVESITITAPKTSINVGETLQLSVSVLPENATNKNVTWSSSDESIGIIDEYGLISTLKEGSVTFSASSGLKEFQIIIQINSVNILKPNHSRVAAGNSHTLVIDDAGKLWSFGVNQYGQLGHSLYAGIGTFGNATPTNILSNLKFVSVKAGQKTSLALDENGQLWGFGHNQYGQLALAGGGYVITPIKVMDGIKVVDMDSGERHTLVLDENGKIWTFGENYFGQLGHSNNLYVSNANPTPTKISDSVFKSVYTGGLSSYAIDKDGYLWSWGYNAKGQLGLSNFSTPIFTPTKSTFNQQISKVAAGYMHTLVLTKNKEIFGAGLNSYGELGLTNVGQNISSFSKTTDGSFLDIKTGYAYSLAIDINGDLWSFGDNYYGQLGSTLNNSTSKTNSPQRTIIGENLKHISGGYYHTIIINGAGQIKSFGYNRYGQLGHATNLTKDFPNPTPTIIMAQ